ncbi:putative hydro-lyase [Helianthus debilis subsp. tardiflorus]
MVLQTQKRKSKIREPTLREISDIKETGGCGHASFATTSSTDLAVLPPDTGIMNRDEEIGESINFYLYEHVNAQNYFFSIFKMSIIFTLEEALGVFALISKIKRRPQRKRLHRIVDDSNKGISNKMFTMIAELYSI